MYWKFVYVLSHFYVVMVVGIHIVVQVVYLRRVYLSNVSEGFLYYY